MYQSKLKATPFLTTIEKTAKMDIFSGKKMIQWRNAINKVTSKIWLWRRSKLKKKSISEPSDMQRKNLKKNRPTTP